MLVPGPKSDSALNPMLDQMTPRTTIAGLPCTMEVEVMPVKVVEEDEEEDVSAVDDRVVEDIGVVG